MWASRAENIYLIYYISFHLSVMWPLKFIIYNNVLWKKASNLYYHTVAELLLSFNDAYIYASLLEKIFFRVYWNSKK